MTENSYTVIYFLGKGLIMGKLVIDGNSVYEIDEECSGKCKKMEEKNLADTENENVTKVKSSGQKYV